MELLLFLCLLIFVLLLCLTLVTVLPWCLLLLTAVILQIYGTLLHQIDDDKYYHIHTDYKTYVMHAKCAWNAKYTCMFETVQGRVHILINKLLNVECSL